MFFSKFPKMLYDIDGNGNLKIVTDLLRRVKVRSSIRDSLSLFDKYDVQNGETPESIAYKVYGDTEYHYIILMLNNITDRYYGWPLTSYEFENYVNEKYANPDGVHHYEITQSSGRTTGEGPSDYEHKIIVNSTEPGAVAVTNRQYEERLQDQKRQIKLLDPAYLPLLLEEFENLMSE